MAVGPECFEVAKDENLLRLPMKSKLIAGIEFGPADVLESIIRSFRTKNNEDIVLRILDIGSGGAKYWEKICATEKSVLELALFDPNRPKNLETLREFSNVTHFPGQAPGDLSEFQNDEFDIVVAFDLIEHLTKEDGYSLVYEIDRICRWTSLVFTPNGFVWQPPSRNNKFNAHISGWTPRELRSLGWKPSFGHTGFKWLFKSYGLPAFDRRVPKILSYASALLVRKIPRIAFSFSAIKKHSPTVEYHQEGIG